jgi:hypothetical protein
MTPRDKICDDCGVHFPDNNKGDWNRFMEKCGKCYAKFLSQEDSEEDNKGLSDDSQKSAMRSLWKLPVCYWRSAPMPRLKLDDGSFSTVFSEEEYILEWFDVLEHRSCFHRRCTALPLITCSREVHWLCEEHCEEECCAYRLDDTAVSRQTQGSKAPVTVPALLKSLLSLLTGLTPEQTSSIDMIGVERQYAMLVMTTDLTKRVKSKYAYDANLGPRPDYYEFNKWILCDTHFSVSSIAVLILTRVYVRHKDTGELSYNYKDGRTKSV